jgi:integrase
MSPTALSRLSALLAIQQGIATNNPAGDLDGIIKQRKVQHRASLPREELPQFLQSLETYSDRGRMLTQRAIKLLLLTFVCSGELRGARWDEFDLKDKVWRVSADRMKMRNEHLVPLSRQALEVLELLKPMTGKYDLIFPSERQRDKVILIRIGVELVKRLFSNRIFSQIHPESNSPMLNAFVSDYKNLQYN